MPPSPNMKRVKAFWFRSSALPRHPGWLSLFARRSSLGARLGARFQSARLASDLIHAELCIPKHKGDRPS